MALVDFSDSVAERRNLHRFQGNKIAEHANAGTGTQEYKNSPVFFTILGINPRTLLSSTGEV